MIVRVGRVEELGRLVEVELAAGAAFRDVGMAEIAEEDPGDVVSLGRYLAAGRLWVAAEDGAPPVAYLVAEPVDGGLHVEQVSVHPDAAHRRIGSRLIDRAGEAGAAEGLKELTLTTFTDVPWNAPYYARLGFEVVPDDALTPGLRAVVDREIAHGLHRWPRVVMRRPV